MLKLFFRKNFYEGWDNLAFFLVPNLIMDAVVALLIFLGYVGRSSLATWIAVLFIGIVLICILNLAFSECAGKFVDYKSVELKEFFKSFNVNLIFDGIFLGIIYFLLVIAFITAFVFYFDVRIDSSGIAIGPKSLAGMTAGFVCCWIIFVIFVALQWFSGVRSILHDNFRKTLKKSFILFFDNIGVSFVLFFYNLFLSVLSIVLFGLAPGAAGIVYADSNAFYLLLKKYDYLDELQKNNPSGISGKVKIPWNEILKNDEEITGHRTLKQFIMPWKY